MSKDAQPDYEREATKALSRINQRNITNDERRAILVELAKLADARGEARGMEKLLSHLKEQFGHNMDDVTADVARDFIEAKRKEGA